MSKHQSRKLQKYIALKLCYWDVNQAQQESKNVDNQCLNIFLPCDFKMRHCDSLIWLWIVQSHTCSHPLNYLLTCNTNSICECHQTISRFSCRVWLHEINNPCLNSLLALQLRIETLVCYDTLIWFILSSELFNKYRKWEFNRRSQQHIVGVKVLYRVKSAGWRGRCSPKYKNHGSSFSRLVGESMAHAGQHCVLVT